jgi:hypothetical protein
VSSSVILGSYECPDAFHAIGNNWRLDHHNKVRTAIDGERGQFKTASPRTRYEQLDGLRDVFGYVERPQLIDETTRDFIAGQLAAFASFVRPR